MREFKYRAFGHDRSALANPRKMYYSHEYSLGTFFRFFENYDLMEYTGKKDEDGKDVYEGDICAIHYDPLEYDVICEVIFEDGGFKFKEWYTNGEHLGIDEATCKVLGNIYENPEFLEKR